MQTILVLLFFLYSSMILAQEKSEPKKTKNKIGLMVMPQGVWYATERIIPEFGFSSGISFSREKKLNGIEFNLLYAMEKNSVCDSSIIPVWCVRAHDVWLQFIKLPVLYKKNLSPKFDGFIIKDIRFPSNNIIGIVPGFLLKNFLKKKDRDEFNWYYLGFTFGSGAEYNLSPKFSLSWQIRGEYTLNEIIWGNGWVWGGKLFSGGHKSDYNLLIGLLIGCSYNFSKN